MLIHKYLNNTLLQLCGTYPHNGDIGLELEAEGFPISPFETNQWRIDPHEHSLRGGFEWLLYRPISIQEVPETINEWYNAAKANNCQFKTSLRTSIHIHVNIQQFTLLQFYTFLTLYYLVENVLVRYGGNTREGNLFCLRLKDADYTIHRVVEYLQKGQPFTHIVHHTSDYKYAALNLAAITKYGSAEFRMMRGEYNKGPEFIIQWINALYNLVHVSTNFSNPKEVMKWMKGHSPLQLLERLFSPAFVQELIKVAPDYQSLIMENYDYSHHLATALPDWTPETVVIEPPKPKKKSPYEEFLIKHPDPFFIPVQPFTETYHNVTFSSTS